MPGYKGHLCGGVAAFTISYMLMTTYQPIVITTILPVVILFLITLAGALFPDIDIKSKGQWYFYFLILLLLLYFICKRWFRPLAVLAVVSVLPMLAKHRGLFHNLWFLLGASIVTAYASSLYAPAYTETIVLYIAFFVMGVISHLWLDMGFLKMIKAR